MAEELNLARAFVLCQDADAGCLKESGSGQND